MNNLMQAIHTLKSNPAAYLGRMGVSIPQGMMDGNAILNRMLQSGRYSQTQINQAYAQARQILPSSAQNGSFVNNLPKGNYKNGF
jgi:hypothetical protein